MGLYEIEAKWRDEEQEIEEGPKKEAGGGRPRSRGVACGRLEGTFGRRGSLIAVVRRPVSLALLRIPALARHSNTWTGNLQQSARRWILEFGCWG